MKITSAERLPIAALHEAALAAFSDYTAPYGPDLAQFEASLHQRAFDPGLSRVAVEGDAVKAIWLMGRRGARAYLIQSGTRPEARRRGLAIELGRAAEEAARASGCSEISLEVICENGRALPLYETLGFRRGRRLACYRVEAPWAAGAHEIELAAWARIAAEAGALNEIAPSWQNAPESFASHPDLRVRVIRRGGALAAYMVSAGSSVMALATRAELRREGLASALITAHLADESPGFFINIDEDAHGFAAMMEARGIAPFLSQWELRKALIALK